MRGDHKSTTAKLSVLVSARIANWDIPAPEVNIDEDQPASGDTADEAQNLANEGKDDLSSPDDAPLAGPATTDQANLDQEATGVGLTEEVDLLIDEADSGQNASEFGQAICNATGAVENALSSYNNVNNIYLALSQMNSTAAVDLESAIKDAITSFSSVFAPCISTPNALDVAERIVDDIDKLFCQ